MTITIEKPPKLVTDLKLDTAPHPEQHWEGRFDLRESDGDELGFRLVAQLRFARGLIEGEGLLTVNGNDEHRIPVSLSGESTPQVSLTVWMNEEDLVRVRLLCTGQLSADQRRMGGSVFAPCVDPEGCNCAGANGTFDLWRAGEGAAD